MTSPAPDLVSLSSDELERMRERVAELRQRGLPRSEASVIAFRELCERNGYGTHDAGAKRAT